MPHKNENEEIKLSAEEEMEEKEKKRKRKLKKRMPVSGKEVFKIKELKEKREETSKDEQ